MTDRFSPIPRAALWRATFALLGALSLLAFALHWRGDAAQALNAARSELATLHANTAQVETAAAAREATLAHYRQIMAETTHEQRRDWAEVLQGIRDERRLLGLSFAIAAPRPLDADSHAAGPALFVSPMTLELPLLHENDLLGLLADLQARTRALAVPRRCRIERQADAATADLAARCEIDWVLLRGSP